MKKNYRYRELNPTHSILEHNVLAKWQHLTIAIFDYFHPLSAATILSLKRFVDGLKETPTVSFILTQDYQAKPNKENDKATVWCNDLLREFPRANAYQFDTGNKRQSISVFLNILNLFVREAKSQYVWLMPAGLTVEHLQWQKILECFKAAPQLFALSPNVTLMEDAINPSHRRKTDSIYHVHLTEKQRFRFNVALHQNWTPTLVPYRLSFLFDREKFVALNGFDASYNNAFVAAFDLLMRAALQGSWTIGTDLLEATYHIPSKQKDKEDWFESYNQAWNNNLLIANLKNNRHYPYNQFLVTSLIKSLFSFNPFNVFIKMHQLKRIKQIRSSNLEKQTISLKEVLFLQKKLIKPIL